MKPLYIFDLDGTIADNSHRNHFLQGGSPDWTSFTKACSADTPILPVISLMQDLHEAGANITIWTGRTDDAMHETIHWLDSHDVPYGELKMRPAGQFTHAKILKGNWLDELSEAERDDLICMFDDDPKMAEFWKELGVYCVLVPK